MKKYLLSLIALIIMTLSVNAGNIDVLPTMQSKSMAQDRVWVGTFQLVWNDFIDKVAHTIIRFPDGTPDMVKDLNQQAFSIEDLTSKCYYTYTGKVKKNTKASIVKAIRKKFNETSDILDQLDLSPAANKVLIYAMLKKDFEFTQPFDTLGKYYFRDVRADFFGITAQSDKLLRENVKVLFYNNPKDYAVVLTTKSGDEVYLYKIPHAKPFNFIYSDMMKKASYYEGEKDFGERDELKVPNLKFFEEKTFEELSNKRVKGTQIVIDKAIETVNFNMDNKGVQLKSEAAITMCTTAYNPEEEQPRYFYFDDTFILFLKEHDKRRPYFALRVHDISNYQ